MHPMMVRLISTSDGSLSNTTWASKALYHACRPVSKEWAPYSCNNGMQTTCAAAKLSEFRTSTNRLAGVASVANLGDTMMTTGAGPW